MGPLGTSATEWPIVPAPGDCDDGEFGGMNIGRGNRSTRRKPAPEPLCLPQIALARPALETGPPRWEASFLAFNLTYTALTHSDIWN
jgi:hypothetical protein